MNTASYDFVSTVLAVVLASILLVMSVAFVSIPLAIGGHPGEPTIAGTKTGFHPT